MAFVHTAHGLGRIVATETLRGRTRHKVAGVGFEVWLDAADVREASLGDINEDNSTTLPYNPEPQYPTDMWSHETTIQPGEYEIDAEERTSPSDSLSFDSGREVFPAPSPDLFAKSAGYDFGEYDDAPYTGEGGTYNDSWTGELDERYRNHPDSWSHRPTEKDYEEWEARHGKGKEAGVMDKLKGVISGEGEGWDEDSIRGWVRRHDPHGPVATEDKGRKANLGPKYASWMLTAAPEGDNSVSRFRRDPIQEINRLGYLWSGNVEQPEMADYGRLVEADKMLREAAWADVRRKAQRLRREGRVHVLHRSPGNIYANVDGDHGTYTVALSKTGNTQSIDKWACSCEWGKWAFQRKISYVGRLCSHGYASYLELQSDDHKGNPGRFHAPRRTASLVDDFQDYVDDFRDGHVDIDAVDNFITLPEHSNPRLDAGQVDELYDWAWDNRTEREPRNYKMPYMAAADGGEGVPRLRTQPRSLTPDLVVVPRPEGSNFVDVEEDERETTGPDQIMHTAALMDANGNPYRVSGFWHTAAPDETVVEDDETGLSAGENSVSPGESSGGIPTAPGVEVPRVPDSAMTPSTSTEDDDYSAEQSSMADGMEGGFNLNDFMDVASPVIDSVGQFAAPISEGIGNAIGNFGSGLLRGSARYANEEDGGYHNGVTNDYIPQGKIDKLRELSDEDPDLGSTREQNEELRDTVDYLRDHGFDANPIVAALDPRDDSSAGEYRDHSLSRHRGNGMYSVWLDGKGQHSADTLGGIKGIIDDHLDGGRREANYDAGPATVFGGPPGGAFGQPGGGPWADRSYSGSGPDPKWWYSDSEEAIAEHLDGDHIEQVDVLKGDGHVNHMPDSERPPQSKTGMNDVVRRFQASGGGALAGDGGGNYGDDDIAGQARKFLAKTAGRVYSLAEQQELVEESHPGGARNKPTDDDLAGTHYV